MRRTSKKVNGTRKGAELASHFLGLLRSGAETPAFLSSRDKPRRNCDYYDSQESVSDAALDTEYKKALGTIAFHSRHRYL